MSKKLVCTECGFLGWLSITDPLVKEVAGWYRNKIKDGTASGQEHFGDVPRIPHTLYCHRKQWTYTKRETGIKWYYDDISQINQSRSCSYYYEYHPGYNPEEHKELKRDRANRKTIRNATLLGACIGATAAIVAQLIYVIVTGG
jgi:hypothetical protein